MRLLVTVYGDQSTWGKLPEEQAAAELEAFAAFGREAKDAGVLVTNGALQPADAATTVRVVGGKRTVTGGPVDDAIEQMGCFYILDCDLDGASEWAAKTPLVGAGGFSSIEIRPVMP